MGRLGNSTVVIATGTARKASVLGNRNIKRQFLRETGGIVFLWAIDILHPMQDPVTLVIFGATGDLTQRKLIPALLDLKMKGLLPDHFRIVAFSRRPWGDDAFRAFLREAIARHCHGHPQENVDVFLALITYVQGTFDATASYEKLATVLATHHAHTLFYLATPPQFYETILQRLADSGLTKKRDDRWTRVLVEKPFGRDLATAEKLDQLLGSLFSEEQVFRIDHYLAKETVQNILLFRFSNALFEPIWNHRYIDRVAIRLHEATGVTGRGEFYDITGSLRDVGQNHLLQMLALIAMEHPGELTAPSVRHERERALRALRPIDPSHFNNFVQRGQYEGYTSEDEVARDSQTETFFRIVTYVDNKRWRSVPFILESGTKLKETKTEISLFFKKAESCLCPPEKEQHHEDVLTFRIQPQEGISLLFWAKQPGFDFHLEPKKLAFAYHEGEEVKRLPDAYERVLYDCIRGDQLLFASTGEVEAEWRFITPIIDAWQSLSLSPYQKGSDGPTSSIVY